MAHQIIRNLKCNSLMYRNASKFSILFMPPVFFNIQSRQASNKHWNPKFKRERKEKFQKIELPDYDEKRRDQDLPIDEVKAKLKKSGILPNRPWYEKPMHVSCLGSIVDAYIPPEGDAKAATFSTPGMKQTYDSIGKKGKSYLALRKIRNTDYEFDIPTFAENAKDIYIKAQTALMKYDEDQLHELVTEKAYPEITENVKNKVIKWKYIQTLEHPRVVHIRCQEMQQRDNMFAQITLRLFSQETLAVYDRFGRLMYGSEDTLKDTLQYIVFEKHITSLNGAWRIHGKIIPDWLPPKEPIKRTYFLPDIDIPSEPVVESKSLEVSESDSKTIESVKQ
ncbi:large ribosomal subunit protein mL45 [Parasteatoda tepidariorum]|uniref:large ribosomal subunit protein mL45 n=1 Tax=Parasteatoda tepidariorum TaxID=114398 RepID=UPI001C71BE10|nr:probable 39S ribosomal protein L45, mitochondrial [Parasteatoda tepidariorum]